MGKKTSSKQWDIPMLNARKHVHDKDTRGYVSSRVRGNRATKDK